MTQEGASKSQKPMRLSLHAQGYLARRGFDEEELRDAIRSSPWQSARNGRFEASKDFLFNQQWNGVHYATKRVRPVFVEEPDEIVVTVYTYFF